jgi:hypothetical protein
MQEVVKVGDKFTQKTVATAIENSRNVHVSKCKMASAK